MNSFVKIMMPLFVFLFPSGSVGAASLDKKLAHYFNVCPPNLSDKDTSFCLGKQYALADAEMNRTWRQVFELIKANTKLPVNVRNQWKHNFTQGQQFWVGYKEAECRGSIPHKFWQGSMESVASISCFLRLTVLRTFMLEDYL